MAYVEPRSWTDTEFVDDDIMNAHIRDNFRAMGPHLIARKTADQNTISTTLASDDTLFTPSIAANEVWRLTLIHSVITGAGGMKSAWSIPTGSELQMTLIGTGTVDLVQQRRQTASDTPTMNYTTNASAARLYIMEVLFMNGGTANPLTFRWALDSASGTSTVKANSTLWGVKLSP